MVSVVTKSAKGFAVLIELWRVGEVVAAPTETAYGLLADATNASAVRQVVALKGRSERKPIALIAGSLTQVERFFILSAAERRLARTFWPGALTLLLKSRRTFPKPIIGPGGRVGVRVPASAWLRRLVQFLGRPLTATSANRADRPTLYSSAAVVRQLAPRGLAYVVDGGVLPRRAISTVALVNRGTLTIVRAGAVSERRLRRALQP